MLSEGFDFRQGRKGQMKIDLSAQIKELYAITKTLEDQFPGRRFTPDGHLVGSIGEVLVADCYGLKLLPNSTQTHDAVSEDGKQIQIKVTQVKRINISSEPDYLIAIKLLDTGDWEEVYSGPGKMAWDSAGKLQKNGQRSISLAKLRKLMEHVPEGERIKVR